MLCSLGGHSYAFVHRTFLEYFCAAEILERFQVDQTLTPDQLKVEIFGHWADEPWHEVLYLLAGMIAPRFVGEILEYLLQKQAIFLAARCLGEVRNRNELGAIVIRVFDHVKALVFPDSNFYYAQGEWSGVQQGDAPTRIRAVRTIAMIWPESPDTRTWLKACAQSDRDPTVREVATKELTRCWKENPDTLQWLKARSEFDKNPFTRRAALESLAHGWKDDPDTLPILKAGIQSEQDPIVRSAALEALARGWKDDPETLLIVKAVAQNYRDPRLTQVALQELVRSWKDDLDTLPILKAAGQSNEYSVVRQAAVQSLAHGWKDDPEILL